MERATVETTKQVRPDQLKEELGGADVFTSDGIVQAEGVAQEHFEAAVEAHVAVYRDPDKELRDAIRQAKTLEELKDALTGESASNSRVAARPS